MDTTTMDTTTMDVTTMGATPLPPRAEMLDAFLSRDATYDGIFYTGVSTTGIFCRPACPARKPRPENVEFFPSAQEALVAGFRPCRKCRPLEPAGRPPRWLRPLLADVEEEPARRWSDQDLRDRGLSPERVRRWFRRNHGMTFHAYSRAMRMGAALGRIRRGAGVARTAFEHGYDSLSGFNEAFKNVLGAAPTAAKDAPVVSVSRVPTPLGPMIAGTTGDAICLLEFADRRMLETQLARLRDRLGCAFVPGGGPTAKELRRELEAYFGGRLERFEVPVRTPGTAFQQSVWDALAGIPYGQTRSYKEVAESLGRPTAVRAVARANGDNRVAILIPCHRVVGSDGALTGYGGGLWRKRRLLQLERG